MTDVAQRYAQALYALARDEDVLEPVLKQMQVLSNVFREEPDFLRLLASPNLSKEERCDLIDVGFRHMIHPYLLNYLKILAREGTARMFHDCCRCVENNYYSEHGIILAVAYTAQRLRADQAKLLREKLEAITGKTVRLENRIDPDCIGGVRLCYDGKQVDGTVKYRLESIQKLMKIPYYKD